MFVVEMFAFDMGGLHIYYFKNHTSLLAFVFFYFTKYILSSTRVRDDFALVFPFILSN